MTKTHTELRTGFFNWLFEDKEGYVCIAHADAINPRQSFKQKFFHWLTEQEELLDFVDKQSKSRNVWYGINLLDKPERRKENCLSDNLVWSDLDTADPDNIKPQPNMVIQSSLGHYQGIWKLDQTIPTDVAEDYSKRIAYTFRQDGADPTGWDLTQLLRVPYTHNFKYKKPPLIEILPNANPVLTPIEQLEILDPAPVSEVDIAAEYGMPEVTELPSTEGVLYKYQPYLDRSFYELMESEPEHSDDWSSRMWKFINLGFEAGMEPQEVFAVSIVAKCNKYQRDRRPVRFLWREVLKAFEIQKRINVVTNSVQTLTMPQIWDEDDYEETFIDRYTAWASKATDAVPAFHDLSGAILLSASLAGHVKLEASYGTVTPNLWGLILGASTIDRKTTAMELAKSILWEVDQDALLATDGSAEGFLQGLSLRPGRSSMFHKDEVSGFFKSINRKDYLSGMTEILTDLYDAKRIYRRILRKESIEIHNPVFIFFAGGIKEEVFANLSDDHVMSGFLPRFLVVIGQQDVTSIRPTGMRTDEGFGEKQRIIDELTAVKALYVPDGMAGTIRIAGQEINLSDIEDAPITHATMNDEALAHYQKIEITMVEAAYGNYYQHLALPTFERLSRSLMKLSILLAASRQEAIEDRIIVEKRDVVNSSRYVQRWGRDSIELMLGAGKTQTSRTLDKVRRLIENKPGIARAELMRTTHLTSRDMTEVLSTLADRGEVRSEKKGKAQQWWTVT